VFPDMVMHSCGKFSQAILQIALSSTVQVHTMCVCICVCPFLLYAAVQATQTLCCTVHMQRVIVVSDIIVIGCSSVMQICFICRCLQLSQLLLRHCCTPSSLLQQCGCFPVSAAFFYHSTMVDAVFNWTVYTSVCFASGCCAVLLYECSCRCSSH
jgi:hypothetical protein